MEMSQYLEVFLDESREHLQRCNEALLALEKEPNNLEIVNEMFRSAHTLKGMSATMGYEDIANVTHQMENVLDLIRNEKLQVQPALLDVVFASLDDLEAMVESIASGGDGKRNVTETLRLLKLWEQGNGTLTQKEVAATKTKDQPSTRTHGKPFDEFEQTVLLQSMEQGFSVFNITVTLTEDCLLKAARVFMVFEVLEKLGDVLKSTPTVEELEDEKFDQSFIVTLVTNKELDEVKAHVLKVSEVLEVAVDELSTDKIKQDIAATQEQTVGTEDATLVKEGDSQAAPTETKAVQSKTIRVNIERLDVLMNLFEELVIDRGRLEQIAKDVNRQELTETVERMSRISGDLQSIILTMRMVPVETVFNRFPRMVRQLSRDLGKQIELRIEGADTELDRTVIDEIGDPLVHLIRNAIDHGIETPEKRTKAGKKAEGSLVLKAFHSGNHVFIEIRDNGGGINRDKVLQKAIQNGVVDQTAAHSLSDNEVYQLIFASGFSTADQISDISGRGVGLDVVKKTIESLGGSVTVSSTPGEGSVFSIQLPLTLSIIAVMLVVSGNETYAIPLSSIIETAILKEEEIMYAHNQRVIDFRGKVVPLVFLEEVFQVPKGEKQTKDGYHSVILVRKGEKVAGLVVDSFIGQQEVVLKTLGNYLTNVFAISGATILGDGEVALIVDCNALL
ncbi:chemotaxis protein CheA [Bacillus fonticola]|uniref:chemotaxis protein CheA n=1 Tax=Bacillus fonticola TaxID=2728853 RepID=UPI0014759A81|nr:chemotaxis protein CheA [Bacillus fonticola]